MKKLVLGRIPADYSRATHILVDPGSVLGAEFAAPDLPGFPFPSSAENYAAARIATAEAKRRLPALAQRLNEINGVDHSLEFWRVAAFPWLLYLVHGSYERLKRIDALLERERGTRVEVELLRVKGDWGFASIREFIDTLVASDDYNHWFFSRFLENRLPAHWTVTWRDVKAQDLPLARQPPVKQTFKRYLYDRWLARFLRCNNVPGMGLLDRFVFSLILQLKPSKPRPAVATAPARLEESSPVEWATDFDQIVLRSLPASFQNIARFRYRSVKPRRGKFFVETGWLRQNEAKSIALAWRVEHGERVICVQHGGGYGTMEYAATAEESEYCHDVFISWGWRRQGQHSVNALPLPSPSLARLDCGPGPSNGEMLLVGNLMLARSMRLESEANGEQWFAYRQEKLRFIEALSAGPRERLIYRGFHRQRFPNHYEDVDYLKRIFPSLKTAEDPGEITGRMLRSRLVILDHPATSILLVLAANVPFIGFWDPDVWGLCREAKACFDRLARAGVIFPDGQRAGERVSEIWADVEGWWRDPQLQAARAECARNYAWRKPQWRRDWLAAFARL